MKVLILTLCFAFALASQAFADEQSLLARVTVYWSTGKSGQRAYSNGVNLRVGHCAVDPKKIPYGSKVIFPDATCLAVDTGPAVISRKAARQCGRNLLERAALVVDRYFETKQQALAWERAHPHFMTLRIVTSERQARNERLATTWRPRCNVRDMFGSLDAGCAGRLRRLSHQHSKKEHLWRHAMDRQFGKAH